MDAASRQRLLHRPFHGRLEVLQPDLAEVDVQPHRAAWIEEELLFELGAARLAEDASAGRFDGCQEQGAVKGAVRLTAAEPGLRVGATSDEPGAVIHGIP